MNPLEKKLTDLVEEQKRTITALLPPGETSTAWAVHLARLEEKIERLTMIEAAARDLIEYQSTGAPEHLEWEEKFEALEAALRGEDPAGEGE